MERTLTKVAQFDGDALMHDVDEERQRRGLTWGRLADELWMQSADLNAMLGDDALCPGALHRIAQRKTMTCQYALPLLRWLNAAPEDYLSGDVVAVDHTALPSAGADKRLRWSLEELFEKLDGRRVELGLTWAALGAQLDCTPNRLTNLRTAKLADMGLTMRVTQWLGSPAVSFIHATDW